MEMEGMEVAAEGQKEQVGEGGMRKRWWWGSLAE